jgi:TPP-dependent 2-oxoacid decarboxylase
MSVGPSIGQYLLQRLAEEGARHVFSVPGDYILGFYELLDQHPQVIHIGTIREDSAAFTADGYARCQGLGVVAVTGTELATHARLRLNPIVIVFDNGGYSTERFILDGSFNDISPWRFDKLGEVFGPLHGFAVTTEEEFEVALWQSLKITDAPCLLDVKLRPDDPSPGMRRLTERLRKKIKG